MLPTAWDGHDLGSYGPSSVHACSSFHDGCGVQLVEAKHSFY